MSGTRAVVAVSRDPAIPHVVTVIPKRQEQRDDAAAAKRPDAEVVGRSCEPLDLDRSRHVDAEWPHAAVCKLYDAGPAMGNGLRIRRGGLHYSDGECPREPDVKERYVPLPSAHPFIFIREDAWSRRFDYCLPESRMIV